MKSLDELLQESSMEEILSIYEQRLKDSEEDDFWALKVIPYMKAVLSVLLPLRDQKLLFTPEGKKVEKIDEELFYRWSDLVCLRTLAFILEESNEKNRLVRTDYEDVKYEKIDLQVLGEYLSSYRIDLIYEDNLDFPVANYNLHTGLLTIIKKLSK